MDLHINRYLIEANQTICPLISLEVACNMTTHYEIRRLPSRYTRLSCRKILLFVGDNPNQEIKNPIHNNFEPLNTLIYHLIDEGMSLKGIAEYLIKYKKPNALVRFFNFA